MYDVINPLLSPGFRDEYFPRLICYGIFHKVRVVFSFSLIWFIWIALCDITWHIYLYSVRSANMDKYIMKITENKLYEYTKHVWITWDSTNKFLCWLRNRNQSQNGHKKNINVAISCTRYWYVHYCLYIVFHFILSNKLKLIYVLPFLIDAIPSIAKTEVDAWFSYIISITITTA